MNFLEPLFVIAECSLMALSMLRGSYPPTSDDDLAALAGSNGDSLGFLLDMFLFSKEGKKLLACEVKHSSGVLKLGWASIVSDIGDEVALYMGDGSYN